MPLPTIILRHTGQHVIRVPMLGFGAMGISEFYGSTDEQRARDALVTAVHVGANLIDTADNYAFGRNEKFLRTALRLGDPIERAKIILASKCGIVRDEADPTKRGVNISPEYIEAQLQRSLKNLGTDYLDLFYIHRIPKDATDADLAMMMEKLKTLKETGVIHAIGLSEANARVIRLAHKICPLSAIQTEYSLMRRGPETDGVLDTCRELGITFIAYSPLWRGGLSPNFDPAKLEGGDFRAMLPTHTGESWQRNKIIVEKLQAFAIQKGCSLSQLALAWLRYQSVVTIPGMRTVERLQDNLKSCDVVLTPADLKIIDEIAPVGCAQGSRYPEAAMAVYGFAPDQPRDAGVDSELFADSVGSKTVQFGCV